MKYYRNPTNGEIEAFESEIERLQWGASGLVELTPDEVYAHLNPPPPPVSIDMVNAERDRRINAGFQFEGRPYDSELEDQQNIAAMTQLAHMAMVGGSEPDNLRWADADNDFAWIDANNRLSPMGPQKVIDLGIAAASYKKRMIFAARALKNMETIPADYKDDKWW